MTAREDAEKALARIEARIAELSETDDLDRIRRALFSVPDVLALIARVRAAEATIERVREQHVAREVKWTTDHRLCVSCDTLYPCPTVRAIEGSPDA